MMITVIVLMVATNLGHLPAAMEDFGAQTVEYMVIILNLIELMMG